MSDRAWYLRCIAEDVGTHAILVGDRSRVALTAEMLEDAVFLNEDRGLTTATGTYRGVRVTVSAFGMGAPIAAIVLHELADLGVCTFLRLGTALTVGPTALGELVVAQAAVRRESTSATYLPVEYPAVGDFTLTAALAAAAAAAPRPSRVGLYASFDGFYTQMFDVQPGNTDAAGQLASLARTGVVAADMETSAVFIAAMARRVRAGSLCLASVDGHTRERMGHEERVDAEIDLLQVGLDTLTAPHPEPVAVNAATAHLGDPR
ncbi:MAG: hypothetical protein ACRDPY_24355 [Streptosporangiaceae bacterium]